MKNNKKKLQTTGIPDLSALLRVCMCLRTKYVSALKINQQTSPRFHRRTRFPPQTPLIRGKTTLCCDTTHTYIHTNTRASSLEPSRPSWCWLLTPTGFTWPPRIYTEAKWYTRVEKPGEECTYQQQLPPSCSENLAAPAKVHVCLYDVKQRQPASQPTARG